jgi:hypothetical protein
MINILSINCSLAFAPYILESTEAFLASVATSDIPSRVIRQAANGFIIRAEGGLLFRHQNREAELGREEAEHYFATIGFRQEVFDVAKTTDEVVFANVGNQLLLSHPQSEMWLEAGVIPRLLEAFHQKGSPGIETLPEWLTLSGGDGQLLLSDQRNGRWVLLGSDHLAEFKRRCSLLNSSAVFQPLEKPPKISVKGLAIHLQGALKLQETLEEFAATGSFRPYEEITPVYQLLVMRTIEGMKISDGNLAMAMPAKEAQKWAAILRSELEKYQVKLSDRGNIRTVFATVEQGVWILQWGDEVLVSNHQLRKLQSQPFQNEPNERLTSRQEDEYLLLLDKASGGCVALTKAESESHLST